ncbi:MAG: hypothetical protein ACSLE6_18305 [Mycobacterium sp.]
MSTTTELAELHHLIGGLQRCVSSLKTKYGNTPEMRRVVNDAERILNDVERLNIDASELDQSWTASHSNQHVDKIAVPDTQYDNDFWRDVDDEGLGGTR